MSLRMACEASEVIAGAGVMIASMPAKLDCAPTEPISVLIMNGTEDPLVPFEGGQVHFFRQELGEVNSTPDTVAFWLDANQCDPNPLVERLPDLDTEDGTQVQLDTYAGCDGDVSVLMYTIEGGGHTIPGGTQYVPKIVIGRVSHDIHAAEAIWDFFESTP